VNLSTEPKSQTAAPVLVMRGVTKRYPGVVANDGIDLDVRPGEIHALLGENGAGKTTLMNILYGLAVPDAGEIELFGEKVEIASPHDAIGRGICMVHQHFMLVPVLSVADNILLGEEPMAGRFMLDRSAAREAIRELGSRFGLDEPTAVLTPQETREIFEVLRRLRNEGYAIVFISHKLYEVIDIADRITVIRRGKVVGSRIPSETNEDDLAELMVGREVQLTVDRGESHPGEAVLEVHDLKVRDDRGSEVVRGVTFDVRRGEIFGIAGVAGNGQDELVQALTGLRKPAGGSVRLAGEDVAGASPRHMHKAGIGFIPGDRHRFGMVLPFPITDNFVLNDYYHSPYSHGLVKDDDAILVDTKTSIER
jgi:simple sugar transport system ATP-binding protein